MAVNFLYHGNVAGGYFAASSLVSSVSYTIASSGTNVLDPPCELDNEVAHAAKACKDRVLQGPMTACVASAHFNARAAKEGDGTTHSRRASAGVKHAIGLCNGRGVRVCTRVCGRVGASACHILIAWGPFQVLV